MSSDKIVLSAEKREITGKKVRNIRLLGKVPAIVYEKGKDSINIAIDYIPLTKVWSAAGTSQPVELTVGKNNYLTMIKDVHVDPAKNTIMHVAFHAVNKNDPVEAEVPVQIEGDVPAEKLGNFIVRPNTTVLIKALPADLPESLIVMADMLENPGDRVTVGDVIIPPNVEVLTEAEAPLAVVEEPKAVEEPEEEEEATDVDAADVPSENGGEDKDGDSEDADKSDKDNSKSDSKPEK